ncbi:MAG: response regulator [Tannerella sp.]|nr:response regulator [Tannerella sp.]
MFSLFSVPHAPFSILFPYLCENYTLIDKNGIIPVVDDNKGILAAVRMLPEIHFRKVITTTSPHTIANTLHNEPVDVVLLDMNFSAGINTGNEGLYWLAEIRKINARPGYD